MSRPQRLGEKHRGPQPTLTRRARTVEGAGSPQSQGRGEGRERGAPAEGSVAPSMRFNLPFSTPPRRGGGVGGPSRGFNHDVHVVGRTAGGGADRAGTVRPWGFPSQAPEGY